MIANDCHDRSLLLRRAGLYDQEVWGRLCLVGTRYCVSCKQIFIARVTIIIETPLFPSIHFTFGPFLAFIRLWIECIILRPCIGSNFLLISQPNLVSRGNPVSHLCSLPHKAVLPRVRSSRRGGELFIFLTRLRSAKVRVLAAVCLLLLCFINCYSVKWATLVSQSLQGL